MQIIGWLVVSHESLNLMGFAPFFFPFELQIHAIPLVYCKETQIHKHLQLPQHMHKKERKKDVFNVATSVDYGVASVSSWSESICYPETDITTIISTIFRGPPRLLPPFKVNTLYMHGQGQAPRFPHGWKYTVHLDTLSSSQLHLHVIAQEFKV